MSSALGKPPPPPLSQSISRLLNRILGGGKKTVGRQFKFPPSAKVSSTSLSRLALCLTRERVLNSTAISFVAQGQSQYEPQVHGVSWLILWDWLHGTDGEWWLWDDSVHLYVCPSAGKIVFLWLDWSGQILIKAHSLNFEFTILIMTLTSSYQGHFQ